MNPFRVYDPVGTLKTRVREDLRAELSEFVAANNIPFFVAGERTQCTFVFRFAQGERDKDLDNLLKFILDAMQGVVFHNDMDIVRIQVTKEQLRTTDAEMEFTIKSA